MFDKMKQLMEFKKQADQIKRELDAITVEVNEVRGIKLTITGSQTFQTIEVEESLLAPANKKRFESDLLRSVNAAIRKSQAMAAKKMQQVSGLNLPGF